MLGGRRRPVGGGRSCRGRRCRGRRCGGRGCGGRSGSVENQQMLIGPDVTQLLPDDALNHQLGAWPLPPQPARAELQLLGFLPQRLDILRESSRFVPLRLHARQCAWRQKRKAGNAPRKKGRAGKYGRGTHP